MELTPVLTTQAAYLQEEQPNIEIVRFRDHPDSHYCGRGSPLGNPYIPVVDGDRDQVCDKFEVYFEKQVWTAGSAIEHEVRALARKLLADGRLRLGCFCAPLRCHTETVRRHLIENLDYYRDEP